MSPLCISLDIPPNKPPKFVAKCAIFAQHTPFQIAPNIIPTASQSQCEHNTQALILNNPVSFSF